MLRADVEKKMKAQGLKQIDLVINESDTLAMYCSLQGGYLMDCYGHRVDRKRDLWGYYRWCGGIPIKVPFEAATPLEVGGGATNDDVLV